MKQKENEQNDSKSKIDIHFQGGIIKDLSENGRKSVIEFAASSYAVLENEQVCRITIERYGRLDHDVTFK